MTGLWLISYIVMWLLVVGLCLVVVGMLQQIGALQQHVGLSVEQPKDTNVSGLLEDGPAIDSQMREFSAETVNDESTLSSGTLLGKRNLLLFLSPTCEGCQLLADSLGQYVPEQASLTHIIIIMRSEISSCRAFLRLFPLSVPVICDSNREITMGFGVHTAPFGLFYNEQGCLRKKGTPQGREDLLALCSDEQEASQAVTESVN